MIDQAAVDRLGHRQWCPVRECANLIDRQAASFRDAGDDVVPRGLDQPVHGLAVLRSELLAHDPVGRVLVFVALVQLGLDAELVECPAQERHFGHQADQAELTRGLQPDLAEAGGEVVRHGAGAGLAEGLAPGDGRFAGGGECADAGPQLLGDRERDHRAADLGDQADHPRVVAGLVQRPKDGPKAWLAAVSQLRDRVVRLGIDQRVSQIELEEDGRFAAGKGHLPTLRAAAR